MILFFQVWYTLVVVVLVLVIGCQKEVRCV
jgi:hypothetical protein